MLFSTSAIALFDVILTGEYVYLIILVIQGHLQHQKVENTLCVNNVPYWLSQYDRHFSKWPSLPKTRKAWSIYMYIVFQ